MEIKQRLLDYFDDLTPARARAIAQTEVGMASSKATLEGYRQSGVAERKEWLSARDSRVRDSHVELDGMVVNFDEDFVSPLTGARGEAPGMMNDPSEDINCRCTFAVLDETEEPI
jgi:SPP1 gp7 family putative phage head morphogenesis protein